MNCYTRHTFKRRNYTSKIFDYHCQICEVVCCRVQSLSRVQLFETPWTAACHASLSFTISKSLLELTSIELVMPCNHLIPCFLFLLLPSIFPSISDSNESALVAKINLIIQSLEVPTCCEMHSHRNRKNTSCAGLCCAKLLQSYLIFCDSMGNKAKW